jgi:hypothetical protein
MTLFEEAADVMARCKTSGLPEQQHALCGQRCCHQQSSHYAVTRTCGQTVDYELVRIEGHRTVELIKGHRSCVSTLPSDTAD